MKKTEWLMAILLVIVMLTGCLFHPLAQYYHVLLALHSLAGLLFFILAIVHTVKRFHLCKRKA